MPNIELFYDHCAKIFEALYSNFPVVVTFRVGNPDLDPADISEEELHLNKQKVGALHWLLRSKYIHGYIGEWSLEDAVLSEKGLRVLREFFGNHDEPTSAHFRRAVELIFQ